MFFGRVFVAIPAWLLVGALSTSTSTAGEVTLKLKGGGLTVVGELQSFNGESYTVDSKALGVTTYPAKSFDCVAGACPAAKPSRTAQPKPPRPTDRNVSAGAAGAATATIPVAPRAAAGTTAAPATTATIPAAPSAAAATTAAPKVSKKQAPVANPKPKPEESKSLWSLIFE